MNAHDGETFADQLALVQGLAAGASFYRLFCREREAIAAVLRDRERLLKACKAALAALDYAHDEDRLNDGDWAVRQELSTAITTARGGAESEEAE